MTFTRWTADSRRAAPAAGIFLDLGFPAPKPGSHSPTRRPTPHREVLPADGWFCAKKSQQEWNMKMTDELQQASAQQEIPLEPQVLPPLPAQSRKSNKSIWIIVGIALGILCLCSITFATIFGAGLYTVNAEKTPVESVLGDYMRYMTNKDAESAYALFSPRAQRQTPISKIHEMLEGNNFILFEGFQSLSVSNIKISMATNTNPDIPQGTVATVAGIIKFEGGIQGTFKGILEKVDGKWMIDGVSVSVPPAKIK